MPNYNAAHFISNNHNKHLVAHASWYTMNIFLCEFENWSICYDYRCHVWCNILCCNDFPLGTQFIFNGTCLSICMAGGIAYFSEHQLDIMPWHFGSTQFNHIEHEHLSFGYSQINWWERQQNISIILNTAYNILLGAFLLEHISVSKFIQSTAISSVNMIYKFHGQTYTYSATLFSIALCILQYNLWHTSSGPIAIPLPKCPIGCHWLSMESTA